MLTNGRHEVCWQPGQDPPDLLFITDSERWAVEVTRTNQHVRDSGGSKSMSREGVDESLRKLVQKIKTMVSDDCKHCYILQLSAPSEESLKSYRSRVQKAVVQHIKAGNAYNLFLSPGELIVTEEGEPDVFGIIGYHRATTPAGHAIVDVAANSSEMLQEMWARKRCKLAKLKGFDKRVLILINRYPFCDASSVANLLPSIIGNDIDKKIDYIFFDTVDIHGKIVFSQVYPRLYLELQ